MNDHNKPLNGGKIMVLGLAYKKDVDDLRESPYLKIMDLIIQGKKTPRSAITTLTFPTTWECAIIPILA